VGALFTCILWLTPLRHHRSISLWSTQKKKPIYVQALAHGLHETVSEERGTITSPRWITAIGSLRYSDLFASGGTSLLALAHARLFSRCDPGSWDGQIKLWKLDQKLKSFSLVGCVNAPGVINSIQLLSVPKGVTYSWGETKKGSVLLVAGVGQETRMGRWIVIKGSGSFNGSLSFIFSPRT
jgi:ribosomal RNA-processing protein 9